MNETFRLDVIDMKDNDMKKYEKRSSNKKVIDIFHKIMTSPK
jgi:hypothetical protein